MCEATHALPYIEVDVAVLRTGTPRPNGKTHPKEFLPAILDLLRAQRNIVKVWTVPDGEEFYVYARKQALIPEGTNYSLTAFLATAID